MSRSQWTLIGLGSIGTEEEEPLASAEGQLVLDQIAKYDASQILVQVHHVSNVEGQTIGQTNVRLKEDSST